MDTQTETTPVNVLGGIYVTMETKVPLSDSDGGDPIALGAMIADLRREGWNVSAIGKMNREYAVRFTRSWKVGELPKYDGPPIIYSEMNQSSGASDESG